MKTQSKTFIAALDFISTNPKKIKKILLDKRLNQAEKKILEACLLMRDSEFDVIIQSLTPLVIDDPYIEDQRLQLLGTAYNNKSEGIRAWSFYEKARKIRKDHNIHTDEFRFLITCFYINLNLRSFATMRDLFSEIVSFCASQKNPDHFINYTICKFALSQVDLDVSKAKSLLQSLKMKIESMTEAQVINYFILEYNYSLWIKNFEGCYQALEEMKDFRKFRLSHEFKLMRDLLDYYCEGKSIYLYEENFKPYPELYHQVRVLKALDEKDREKAEVAWKDLNQLVPMAYRSDFEYTGLPCIFALCVEKALKSISTIEAVDEGLEKQEKLIALLTSSEAALPKEKVFKLIYGVEALEKEDFNRLQTLISSVRKKNAIDIRYKKGCYFIAS